MKGILRFFCGVFFNFTDFFLVYIGQPVLSAILIFRTEDIH